MSEPSDTAAKTTPGGSLSPDEADRIAARFRPVWELDEGQVEAGDAAALEPSGAALARGGLDGSLEDALDPRSEAKLGAPSVRSSAEPIDVRDTAVDGVPAVQIGASSPSRTSPDGTPPLAAASDEAKAPAATTEAAPPSARRKKVSATKIGLGGDTAESAPISKGARPSQRASSSRADADGASPALEAKAGRSESGGTRASGPVSARAVRAALDEDPVELPVEQRSKLVGWIAIASAAAVVLIGGALWLGGGDEAPTKATSSAGPVAEVPAKATATATTEPATPPTAPLGASTESLPTASAAASAATPAAPASASAQASARPTSAPKASSQPVASTAKPPTTTAPATPKPPTTTKPPAGKPGGIIRDSPF